MSEDDFGDGYSSGRSKGLLEAAIAVGHMKTTPSCRCAACSALRHAIYSIGEGDKAA